MSIRSVRDLPAPRRAWRDSIVATSPVMQALLALVERVGVSTIPVLILGETGSGKEVIAEAIHGVSGRSGPLIAINCAALPAPLAESELFGHVRGAFTGAEGASPGLIRAAHGGTLFLDEVGDLDLVVQAKLLRVIEGGGVRMVGATTTTPVDLRIVAATCRDLRGAVQGRHFRDDLYHRLAGVTLTVPPLRDHPEDIAHLFGRFLAEAAGGTPPEVPPETMVWLTSRPWLGNVRELRQSVRRAVVLGGDCLYPEHFLLDTPVARDSTPSPDDWFVGRRWEEIERAVLTWAIRRHGGVRGAALALGRPRSTIHERAHRLGIPFVSRRQ